ncbi:Uncharacterised protein [uncultured archaeon]|nr:Uncharacterised protein [uncultured archaeon]
MVKLAAERILEVSDLTNLGLFRQAFQRLRESIRDDKDVPAAANSDPEYAFFMDLAVKAGSIISSSKINNESDTTKASERLKKNNRYTQKRLHRCIRAFLDSMEAIEN